MRDPEEQVRSEEAAASRAQAQARLARERAETAGDREAAQQRERAASFDADAAAHDRRAREAREAGSRERAADRRGQALEPGPITDRLLAVAGELLGRPVDRRDLSAAGSLVLGEEVAAAAERLLDARRTERSVGEMLQRALLPEALPLMAGVRLAAAFRPADDLVGGDWYDAFRLPHDRLAFAIGDVVGHGLESAAAANGMRNALRTHALEDPDPGFVARHLNDLANVRELIGYSTFVYGVVDPASATLELINLGHPPALLRRSTGNVEALAPRHPLLAVLPAGSGFEADRHHLSEGDVLLAYTDGLIERRRGNDEERVARLAALLADDPDPDTVVERALAELAELPADDDIAVLCVALSEPAS